MTPRRSARARPLGHERQRTAPHPSADTHRSGAATPTEAERRHPQKRSARSGDAEPSGRMGATRAASAIAARRVVSFSDPRSAMAEMPVYFLDLGFTSATPATGAAAPSREVVAPLTWTPQTPHSTSWRVAGFSNRAITRARAASEGGGGGGGGGAGGGRTSGAHGRSVPAHTNRPRSRGAPVFCPCERGNPCPFDIASKRPVPIRSHLQPIVCCYDCFCP